MLRDHCSSYSMVWVAGGARPVNNDADSGVIAVARLNFFTLANSQFRSFPPDDLFLRLLASIPIPTQARSNSRKTPGHLLHTL